MTSSQQSRLIKGALVTLECQTQAVYEAGDHYVFVGEVRAAEIGTAKDGKAALMYGRALEAFGREIGKLNVSITSIREGKFLKALVREELKQDACRAVRNTRCRMTALFSSSVVKEVSDVGYFFDYSH